MISTRQEKLLAYIVLEYVKTTKPVGSTGICDKLGVSSATVRNDMAALEDMGYLEKNHISSGRIPSATGYKYYVDHLMEPKNLNGEEMLKLQTIFSNQSLKLSDAITDAMAIVSELTNYTTVVLGKTSHDNLLKQIEAVPINDESLIAILVTDKGYVEHKEINFRERYDLNEIRQTVNLINKLLVGTPVDEVGNKLEFEIKPIIGNYIKQHELFYEAFYQAFNEFKENTNVRVKGRNNFLKQPDFGNIEKIRNVINQFDDPDFIKKIESHESGIKCYIGEETNIDDDVAVIKMQYNVNGEEGTIAIIGPKRMEYNRVMTLLNYIKKNIEVKDE